MVQVTDFKDSRLCKQYCENNKGNGPFVFDLLGNYEWMQVPQLRFVMRVRVLWCSALIVCWWMWTHWIWCCIGVPLCVIGLIRFDTQFICPLNCWSPKTDWVFHINFSIRLAWIEGKNVQWTECCEMFVCFSVRIYKIPNPIDKLTENHTKRLWLLSIQLVLYSWNWYAHACLLAMFMQWEIFLENIRCGAILFWNFIASSPQRNHNCVRCDRSGTYNIVYTSEYPQKRLKKVVWTQVFRCED